MGKNQKRKNVNNIEKRTLVFDELRAEDDKIIIGHAAVFNIITDIGGWFREQIAPGAFQESIKEDDIRALFNHEPNYVLGRNKAKTLELEEDALGLGVKIFPPETTYAKDLIVSINRGDISEMSFAFAATTQEWTVEEDKPDLRTLKKVKLFDVSPVTFGAYEDTDVAVRCYNQWKESALKNPAFKRTAILMKDIELLEIEKP